MRNAVARFNQVKGGVTEDVAHEKECDNKLHDGPTVALAATKIFPICACEIYLRFHSSCAVFTRPAQDELHILRIGNTDRTRTFGPKAKGAALAAPQ